jgi:hypothetical protein
MAYLRKILLYGIFLAVLSTVALAILLFIQHLYVAFTTTIPSEVLYSPMQLEFLVDLAKTMIPTVTGLIALLGGVVGYLKKEGTLTRESIQTGLIFVFAFSIVSLGAWVWLLAGVIDSARVFDVNGGVQPMSDKEMQYRALSFRTSIKAAQIGACMFFAAAGLLAGMAIQYLNAMSISPNRPMQPPPKNGAAEGE